MRSYIRPIDDADAYANICLLFNLYQYKKN